MVKSKRNINEFQKAMLTNTKIIGNSQNDVTYSQTPDADISVNPEIIQAYEALASKVNIDKSDLIELALQHFLNLEDVWFQK